MSAVVDKASRMFHPKCLDVIADLVSYFVSNPKAEGMLAILDVNECAFPQLNDCSTNARCLDKEEGFECKCLSTIYKIAHSLNLHF